MRFIMPIWEAKRLTVEYKYKLPEALLGAAGIAE
jgi:hypothetical protein